jgi:hypothetical protein
MKAQFLILVLFLIVCCKSEKNSDSAQSSTNASAIEYFGETIDTTASITVGAALEALKSSDSIMTKVTGYVTGVCQVKGCWMVLSQNPTDSTGLFVKFKDYGFFVPKDLTGSKVMIAGKAFKEVTPVDELKHYAEDEGKSAEEIAKITEPSEEMKFMANGVALLEKAK